MNRDVCSRVIRLADKFNWVHGPKNIRHRIGQDCFLSAVIETYYPRSYHNYAVLLEDDIELSPFYYIWSKYIVLKYRYGPDKIHSKRMYGISLYNQKYMEFPLSGHKKFHPEQVFNNTRYNAQKVETPCIFDYTN